MFKIGEFSCFSRVSVKMLRHYDEINLLKPAHVDATTGYRYYMADQLPRLNQIILLKDLGFSLEQIAHLIDAHLSGDEMRGVLKLKETEIERHIQTEMQRLSQLKVALQHLEETQHLTTYPIIVRQVPSQRVVGLRRCVQSGDISALFDEVEAYVAGYKARSLSPPMLIYHDTEFEDDWQYIEVVIPVTETIPATQHIKVYELQAELMACIVFVGDYYHADTLIQQFPKWLEVNQYRASGALREVYLRFGADNKGYVLPDAYLTDNPASYVTELQLPITRIETV